MLSVTRQTAKGWRYPAVAETSISLEAGGGTASFGMEWINGPELGTYSLQVTPPNDTGSVLLPNQPDVFTNNQVSVTPMTTTEQLGTE